MKYIKTFELVTGAYVDYDVGDIVTCVTTTTSKWNKGELSSALIKGKKYEVIKVYEIPEDKFLGNKFVRVDVKNLESGEISKGWESTRFKLEFEADADKYNI